MTSVQKIIKNIALALAVFLIVSIISGILSVLYALSGVLGLKNEDTKINNEMSMIDFENGEIATLDIDVNFTNLIIKNGDTLRAETNNKDINCKQNNQNLQIKEKQHNLFSKKNRGDLVVYVPKNLNFKNVKISAGAGKIQVENINTENLDVELGAGETIINKLNVTNDCKIESGAGKVSILSGKIDDLNLDIGIGNIEITSSITGNSKIDAGIGNLDLRIQDNKENYTIESDSGIRNIKIDGTKISDDSKYGNGKNIIKIDGGIGNIDIEFNK